MNGAWSYSGRVYVKDAKSDKYEIKCETDIDKLASRKPLPRNKDTTKGSTGTGSNPAPQPMYTSQLVLRPFYQPKSVYIFLISRGGRMYFYSLVAPRRGASKDTHAVCFCREIR